MKKISLLFTLVALIGAALACDSGTADNDSAAATLDVMMKMTLTAQSTPSIALNPTVTRSLLETSTPKPPTATATPEEPTPEPPIAPTETLEPTETPAPPTQPSAPTRTATRPAPTRTATPNNLARPNGTAIRAARSTVTVNGDLSEWGGLPYAVSSSAYKPENIANPADSSATFGVRWDATNLYIAVNVQDEAYVQTQSGAQMYKGDSIEILFDGDLASDFNVGSLSNDDVQVGFSLGDPRTGNPAPQVYIWYPSRLSGTPAGARVVGKLANTGYVVEAVIPWSALGVSASLGGRYGFVVSVSDNDTPNTAEQHSMISSVPRRLLFNPTTWGTLILDP